jgi:phosphoribosylanthranilate isomerase
MKVKVCGMRDTENIRGLLALNPDFVGFIFYDKSPRFVGDKLDEELVRSFPKNVKKVGVFVNATQATIIEKVRKYGLDYVQLHGEELPNFCRDLQLKGINVIKAFAVSEGFNFMMLNNYKPWCDFFLFDTKGENKGGNGLTFDWSILNRYDNEKPFILAGGIDSQNIEEVIKLKEERKLRMIGIDVNSKFEVAPALKDLDKVYELLRVLRPAEVEV